ncbi:MAG: ATP-binding protein [Planctomycetota bacterium]
MRELVVVSGKGGTGKTSIVASFAALASGSALRRTEGAALASSGNGGVVLADCDVDAADLYLVLSPDILRREEFRAGRVARIRRRECIGCGACLAYCRFGAVVRQELASGEQRFSIDDIACEGCGVCVRLCPEGAIDLMEKTSGEWFVSETRHGPMVHARVGVAEANSGKLVTRIRKEARTIAEAKGKALLLVDGPPGAGCPVIASMTGADMVLLVAEPSVSGLHDLGRVAELASKLQVQAAVCVNRSDLNPEMAARIEDGVRESGLTWLGEVPYDDEVTKAQIEGRSVVEVSDGPAARAIREVWRATTHMIWNSKRTEASKEPTHV